MELRQLQTFVQAAKLQSFSRAASQLGYSQSAVVASGEWTFAGFNECGSWNGTR